MDMLALNLRLDGLKLEPDLSPGGGGSLAPLGDLPRMEAVSLEEPVRELILRVLLA